MKDEDDGIVRGLKATPAMVNLMNSWSEDPEFKDAKAALEQQGVKGLDPLIAKYRLTALASANQGDMTELSELVRQGTILNLEEREFVADWLIGAVPKKRGAPPKFELSRRITLANFWLTEIDCDKGEAALSYLQRQFGMARSTVSEHLRLGKKCVIAQEKIRGYRLLVRGEQFEVLRYFKGIDLKSE